MGRYKLESIPYDNRVPTTESLLDEGFSAAARGKYEHAEEIALVILMEANSAGDDKLFAKGKELANACHVPSRFHPDYSQPQAASPQNLADPVEPPKPQGTKVTEISDDIFYACMPEGKRKEAEPWDDSLDAKVFDSRIKPQAVKRALDDITTINKTEHKFWFVLMKVLIHLKWLVDGAQTNDFLRWASLHYSLNWNTKKQLSFADINYSRKDDCNKGIIKRTDITEWKQIKKEQFRDIESYIAFALKLKKTFVLFMVNGKELPVPTDFSQGVPRDREQFLRAPENSINK